MTTVTLPALTSYQKAVWDFLCDKAEETPSHYSGKVAVIKSVRQSGKSFLAQMLLICFALTKRCTSAIYEPTLAQARVQFKAIENYFKGSDIITKANATLLEIEFSNGSVIYFKSMEQSSRGFTISGLLVLDECAYLSEDEIYATLPLINAHNAPLLIASTPFISDGYFYKMFQKGLMDPTDKKLRSFDWSKESEIDRFLTAERKEFYKQTMSRSKYITEVLGEFLSDDGMLFRNIEGCTTDEPIPLGQRLWLGVDWGTGSENDYTELIGVNEDGKVSVLHSTNNLSPMEQITWLSNIINDLSTKAQIAKLTCEQNSIGKVYIDALKQKLKNIRINEFITTNKSKQDLVTTLQLALENGDIVIPREQDLLNQLRGYEAQINPRTKVISYNGKSGTHDDKVMALMMAYHSFKGRLGTYNVSFK